MSTFRPSGPWEFDSTCGEIRPVGVPSSAEQVKAPGYETGSCVLVAESVRSREDGHLLAAAPDLYAALSAVAKSGACCNAIHEPRVPGCEWCDARAALKKARGES